jgi:hypothetical protein
VNFLKLKKRSDLQDEEFMASEADAMLPRTRLHHPSLGGGLCMNSYYNIKYNPHPFQHKKFFNLN